MLKEAGIIHLYLEVKRRIMCYGVSESKTWISALQLTISVI